MKLTVNMPWERDLSVNHCRMGPQGNWHLKPDVEAWMERLAWSLRTRHHQYDGWPIWDLPVRIIVDFRFPDRRRRDTHNYAKVICDSVAAGLGIDDKDIRISTGSVTVNRERPGFTIRVEDTK